METLWNLNAGAKRVLGIAALLLLVFAPGAQAQNVPTLGTRFPLYVADNFGKIVKVDSSGTQTIFTSGVILGSPVALAFDRSGNLYVANPGGLFTNDTILKVDETGTQSVFTSGGNLVRPAGLAFDHRRNLYVANSGNNTVVKVNRNGEQSVLFSAGGFFRPFGLAFDGKGALYVSTPILGQILKEEDGELSVFTQAGFLEGPVGLAFSRDKQSGQGAVALL